MRMFTAERPSQQPENPETGTWQEAWAHRSDFSWRLGVGAKPGPQAAIAIALRRAIDLGTFRRRCSRSRRTRLLTRRPSHKPRGLIEMLKSLACSKWRNRR